MTNKIYVTELYGPVFQGEGRTLGMPCAFLRLAGCNLTCCFCDSKYTWDWKQYEKANEVHACEIDAVYHEILLRAQTCRRVVITGGEPMLQQLALIDLSKMLRASNIVIEVETAGTIMLLEDFADVYNVSLKLTNSGNKVLKAIVPEAIASFRATGKAVWKFVIARRDDLDEVERLVDEYALHPVYIMPEGVTAEAVIQSTLAIADAVIDKNFILTTRLHTLIYGPRRGV